ncbi:uncharacterized protein TNCV_2767231 [Trichonephila clavipes]|nr:uncharacterized protein TNCV_2767231 [Trichonephila clavipes]
MDLNGDDEKKGVNTHDVCRSIRKNSWFSNIFSDKSRFQLCPDDNQRHVWNCPEQRADPAFTIAHHTDPQPGVMVWDAIFFTAGPLWSSLKEHLQPIEDKARSHAACVAMNCLTACQTLPWSSRSHLYRTCLGYDGKAAASTREC